MPNALLRLNTKVRSTGPGSFTVLPATPNIAIAHCLVNWSRASTAKETRSAVIRARRCRFIRLSRAPPGRCGDQTHALLHFAGNLVVAHDGAAVAQAAGLPLHHEHPQRVAGLHHQGASCGWR